MTQKERDDLNALAWKFYKAHGYVATSGYDFSAASHPQERGMFRLAEIAREHFKPRSAKLRKRP